MFQKPKSAKKLFFDVIPKSVDEYFSYLNQFHQDEEKEKFNNPLWHIHEGNPPNFKSEITFNSLINLVSVCNSTEKKVIWGFVKEYDASLNAENNQEFDRLIDYAINFYTDFVMPKKKYIPIDNSNKDIFLDILNFLKKVDADLSSKDIQKQIYEIGKKHNFSNLRDYFKLIYQVLFGQEQGPRLGSFIKLFGISKSISLIEGTLSKNK